MLGLKEPILVMTGVHDMWEKEARRTDYESDIAASEDQDETPENGS